MRPQNWSSQNVRFLGCCLGFKPGRLEHLRGETAQATVWSKRVVLMAKGTEAQPGFGHRLEAVHV